jgi:hypothetical protein
MTPALIAPLVESSYVPPELNPHVIHDEDPVKKQTMTAAMQRY